MTFLTRRIVLEPLTFGLQREPFVLAAWLEGADAAGRVDDYADLGHRDLV